MIRCNSDALTRDHRGTAILGIAEAEDKTEVWTVSAPMQALIPEGCERVLGENSTGRDRDAAASVEAQTTQAAARLFQKLLRSGPHCATESVRPEFHTQRCAVSTPNFQ
jgi:hypothetical protein